MNYKIFFYLFLLTFSRATSQNNLIHNASFEDNDPIELSSPCKISQVENMQVWEDDHQFIWIDPLNACDYLKCAQNGCDKCGAAHSPDWFKAENSLVYHDNNSYCNVAYSVTPVGPNFFGRHKMIQARTSQGYVGMGTGELIEQKFFNSNPIVGNKRYTFSMYVQIPKPESILFSVDPISINPIKNAGWNTSINSELENKNTSHNKIEVNIYPNPSNRLLNFEFYSDSKNYLSIELLDYSGRTIRKLFDRQNIDVGPFEISFDINELPDGFYMIRSLINSKTHINKFIKAHEN